MMQPKPFTLSALVFALCTVAFPADPVIIKTNAGKELIPEGIAVHPQSGTIYLSSLHQNKIVAVEKNGRVKDLITAGQEGFMMGLGMKIDKSGNTLWACTAYNDSTTHKTGLFQIDINSGKILQKIIRTDTTPCFLNDLVIDGADNIYATDTEQGSVYRLDAKTKKLERWRQDSLLHWANGIALSPDEKTLFVASGDKGIQVIDIASKKIQTIASPGTDFYAIDGLAYYNNSLIGVIGWPQDKPQTHRVLRFHLTKHHQLLKIDTLGINQPYLNCPTTLSLQGDNAFVLATTNLGMYNRNGTRTKGLQDSLQHPVVLQYRLAP